MDVTNHDRETDVYDRSVDRYDRRGAAGDPEPFGDDRATMIGAAFADRRSAHAAVHDLHDEGFRDTWIGITRRDDINGYAADEYATNAVPAETSAASNDTRVESDNWFMRFFGEGDESLHDALVRHGVTEADARAAGTLPADSAILTVDGGNHPEMAAQIISENGGQLITSGFGATGYGTPGVYANPGMYGAPAEVDEAPMSRTTSLIEDGGSDESWLPGETADTYGRYRAGVSVDESTRRELRAERLAVDKSRVIGDEAAVGTEFEAGTTVVGVPVVREEVFMERRLGSSDTSR